MLIVKNGCRSIFLFLLLCTSSSAYSAPYPPQSFGTRSNAVEKGATNQNILRKTDFISKAKKTAKKMTYYIYIQDFVNSFIQIPSSNVSGSSSTISSTYLAGRAQAYNKKNKQVGTCSASFLCMQNANGIFTDISNYLSIDNGLIISWFTPTTLINLELDSIVNSMVTECIVKASTKIGSNPFYGKKYNMIVSSDQTKIYFKLKRI